jgi:hypothetical protein
VVVAQPPDACAGQIDYDSSCSGLVALCGQGAEAMCPKTCCEAAASGQPVAPVSNAQPAPTGMVAGDTPDAPWAKNNFVAGFQNSHPSYPASHWLRELGAQNPDGGLGGEVKIVDMAVNNPQQATTHNSGSQWGFRFNPAHANEYIPVTVTLDNGHGQTTVTMRLKYYPPN